MSPVTVTVTLQAQSRVLKRASAEIRKMHHATREEEKKEEELEEEEEEEEEKKMHHATRLRPSCGMRMRMRRPGKRF